MILLLEKLILIAAQRLKDFIKSQIIKGKLSIVEFKQHKSLIKLRFVYKSLDQKKKILSKLSMNFK